MTAAEVPQGAILILRDYYDSREGLCGTLRIRAESLPRLRDSGSMPKDAMYHTSTEADGVNGLVIISIDKPQKKFFCLGQIQPMERCPLLIYEQSYEQRPGT